MKAAIIVCDGMADRPIGALGKKTPLEVADTPNMDELATRGINGIADPIAPGIRAGSDTSHLAILGYDPFKVYTGRGPFEAVGMGIELEEGDVAFRCNFVTIEGDIVKDRRASRIKNTEDLARFISNIPIPGVEVLFRSLDYRAALVFRGAGLSGNVSDSDPHVPGVPMKEVMPLDDTSEARYTADIANEFLSKVRKALENNSPANMLTLRGCGATPKMDTFRKKCGLDGTCIATTAIIKGIAGITGLEILKAKESYKDRCKQGIKALEKKDFLLMNIKEADETAHDQDHIRKIDVIEKIDAALGEFLDFTDENYLALLSDHTTSVSLGDHAGDPVPVVIAGPEVRTDSVMRFDERSVTKGGLCRIKSNNVLPILLDLMNKTEKFGA